VFSFFSTIVTVSADLFASSYETCVLHTKHQNSSYRSLHLDNL
jgi:hypothetical protein